MLRGLKVFSLTIAAKKVVEFKGWALLHVARAGAVGDLSPVIEHSDNGTSGWTAVAGAVNFPDGTDLAGTEATAEIAMDKFKPFIRLSAASIGDATIVAQSDGF